MNVIIEICPLEGRASPCLSDGSDIATNEQVAQDFADCRASGDNESACRYVLDIYKPEFRIVARNGSGTYENRLATDAEMQATCEAIYFESETDFTDSDWCKVYLIWQAASELEQD